MPDNEKTIDDFRHIVFKLTKQTIVLGVTRKKTRNVKNIDKSKKYILIGQRNTRYHEKILSNKKKS